jgi:dephospho-CoA kinase
MIIGICGLKGSGKTTVLKHLESKHGFVGLNFADALKRAVMDIFLLSESQCHDQHLKEVVDPRWGKSPREILQRLGTEVGRNLDREVWIKRVFFEVESRNLRRATIGDVRFFNEAQAVRDRGGIVVGIDRPGLVPDNHPSELEMVQNWNQMVDVSILNDSNLEALYEQIDALLNVRLQDPPRRCA